jgi:hypothetical protein
MIREFRAGIACPKAARYSRRARLGDLNLGFPRRAGHGMSGLSGSPASTAVAAARGTQQVGARATTPAPHRRPPGTLTSRGAKASFLAPATAPSFFLIIHSLRDRSPATCRGWTHFFRAAPKTKSHNLPPLARNCRPSLVRLTICPARRLSEGQIQSIRRWGTPA